MPDISMCSNHKCPLKDMCYRYRAIPSDYQYYQSYEFVIVDDKIECDGFWPIEDRKDVREISRTGLE